MSRWPLNHRLNLLLAAGVIFTAWGPLCFEIFDAGTDVIQFYAAGRVVQSGHADRLYDQTYFQSVQTCIPDIHPKTWYYSLYPPTVALMMSPLARLPYLEARLVWWIVEGAAFIAAGFVLYRWMPITPRWKPTAILALAAMFPVWMALRVGQLTPLWLLALAGGTLLHHRGRRLGAGLVMSVLFMKPQLAAPAVVWLVLRRDLRALCGMALGAAIQVLAVMVLLGPAVPLNYVVALPGIGRAAKLITLTGAYEQSFGGTISNVLRGWYWLMPERHAAAAAAQLVVAVLAGFLLLKIVEANRRLARRGPDTAYAMHYEYAAAALFLLVATPHLLLYDVSLLAVPIVWLWSSPGWRMGMVLYLSA
ncbi:MAG: glycosyltransferase family 87 protein, partial [Thermoguttaceae bacterium]